MRRSFRVRLLLVMATVVMVSTIAVAVLSRRATHVELRREQASALGQLRDAIQAARASTGSWDAARAAIASRAMTERTVVVDAAGRVVIAPTLALGGTTATARGDGAWQLQLGDRRLALRGGEPVVGADGARLGTVLVLPAALDEGAADSVTERVIDRGLIWIVVAVGLVGIALSVVIGGSVARPLERLTAAVDRIARGDKTARIEASSGGELAVLARAFNGLLESLAEQERLRRALMSDVAHELRSPLANIRCQLEAMQDDVLPRDATTIASTLDEALRLGRLIDDLQELALAEAGGLRLDPVATDVAVELERIAAVAKPRAVAAEIALDVELGSPLPPIAADPARLAQILRNLLDNAITHTPPGGRIAVSAHARAHEVEIRVTDTGRGIAPEHLASVFERFYRADPSRARATGGAGLGLAIVKQLVLAHGGRIWVDSAPGRGTAMAFVLPVALISSS